MQFKNKTIISNLINYYNKLFWQVFKVIRKRKMFLIKEQEKRLVSFFKSETGMDLVNF